MTREQTKELLPYLEAFANGKTIQCRPRRMSDAAWEDTHNPSWQDYYEYRTKPEPREFWVNLNNDGSPFGIYNTPEFALRYGNNVIKVREVIE